MKSVGIDIGSHAIKVVEIDSTTKGFVISRRHHFPISQRLGQDHDLEIIDILRNLVTTYDPSQTKYIVGIRQDHVTVRHKIFPFIEKLKILKTLPLELEDEIPFDSENLIFDFKTIAIRGTQAEVLACAVPIHHIEKLTEILKDSNIDPEIISSEGLALSNLLEPWNRQPPNLPVLPAEPDTEIDFIPRAARHLNILVHIGYTRTIVCAMEDDHLVAVRSILWGAKYLAEAIARKYELPLNEALTEMELKAFILLQKQDASFEAKIFSDTIAKSVRDLVKDLQISLLAIRSELHAEITQVAMMGGITGMQGLGPFMTQHLEMPVNRLDPFDRFPQTQFERDPQKDSMYAVALGLAIEGLKKPRNPAVNFLRGKFAKQNTRVKQFIAKWSLGLQLGAAAIAALFVWSFVRESFADVLMVKSQEALITQAKSVANLPRKQANENGVRSYIREKKKVVAESRAISQVMGMNSALEILKKVSDGTPGRTEITLDVVRFTVKDARVTVEGYVNNTIERDQFKSRLSGLSLNKTVTDLNIHMATVPGRVGFGFAFDVDRNVQAK